MGKYSVPEEIRSLKPKGTIVKKIKNNYYVYSHSQMKDGKTGRWKTAPGSLLGKIVPGVGYCPNTGSTDHVDRMTCFDYGEYLLAFGLAKDEYGLLLRVFNPDEAMVIFFLATLYSINGFVGIRTAESEFERSLLHRDYPELHFSYHIVSKLLELIGRTGKQAEFQRLASSTATAVAIDGHVIPTFSEDNGLASIGYKSKTIGCTYMNLMVALDVTSLQPIATHVFPGYMLDKSDFASFCSMIGDVSGRIFLVDMGFFSQENIDYIKSKGNYYVIPVSENRTEYKTITRNNRGRPSQFLYHRNRKVNTVEFRERTIGGRRCILFRNITEAEKLSTMYLQAIESGRQGYSSDGYAKLKDGLGVIVLETNLDLSPKEIYELYKSRWTIETYYDRLKNGIHFEALNLDDYAVTQGLAFVMMVAGRIDARILEASRKTKMSHRELLQLMKYIKLYDDRKTTRILNMKKRHQEVLSQLGITIDTSRKCLDGNA